MSCWRIAAHCSCSANLNSVIVVGGGGMTCSQESPEGVPHVFYWQQVWRPCLTIHAPNILTLQQFWNIHCNMRCSIVVHEEKMRIHRASKKKDIRKKKLGTIAGISNWTSLEDVEVNTANIHDTPQMRTLVLLSKSLSMMLEVWFCVSCSLHMCLRPESWVILKWLSSERNTRPHCWFVKILCSWHHRKRRLRLEGIKGTDCTGNRENKPSLCIILSTIKLDIERPVVHWECFTISRAICRLLLFAYREWYRYSAIVVTREQPTELTTKPSHSCSRRLKCFPSSGSFTSSWYDALRDPELFGHTSLTATFF